MSFSKKAVRHAVYAVVLFGVLSCENPFKSDLGEKVDITPPVLTIESPVPGQDVYLHGIVPFYGTASDDRGVSAVQVSLDGGSSYQDISFNAETGRWSYDYNTLYPPRGGYNPDGPMTIMFRAIDNDDRIYETNALSFYIKNTPPQLELNSPSIVPNKLTGADGEPGPSADRGSPEGQAANLAYVQFLAGNFSQTKDIIDSPDTLPTGNAIRGFASANNGIHPGYPQIVFWEDGQPDPATLDANPENWDWKVMEFDEVALGKTLTAKAFRYTLIKKESHYYTETVTADTGGSVPVARLEDNYDSDDYLDHNKKYYYRLRVMDAAGRLNYYPPDDNPSYGEGVGDGAGDGAVDGFFGGSTGIEWVSRPGKRYITQTLSAPQEKPTIEAVSIPYDVSVYTFGSPGTMPQLAETVVPRNAYHNYVNSAISYKRGDFVFQVLTAHSGVIDENTTKLTFNYYQFPVKTLPDATGVLHFDSLSGSDATGGLAIGLEGRDPVTQGKVYQFTSNNPGGGFSSGQFTVSSGTHPDGLQEGMYEFKVYAESAGSGFERTFTVYVDKTDPGIQINVIEGAIQGPDDVIGEDNGTTYPKIETYNVNGHIKVRLTAYENQTLLRSYTENPGDNPRVEQKYFISGDAPADLSLAHGDLNFPGEGALSSITAQPFESGIIVVNTRDFVPSGSGVRYLYMFDRDAAFNAGYKYIKLNIDQDEDKPKIETEAAFKILTDPPGTLTKPDDLLDAANKGNRLGTGDTINLSLSDDDSLLLSDDASHVYSKWVSPDKTVVKIARQSSATSPYYTEADLKEMPIGRIRTVFGTNEGYRVPETNRLGIRKEQDVQIGLEDLNTAFGGSGALPDGKYYVEITVYDHQGVKYWITQLGDDPGTYPGDDTVDAVSETLKTWIAVDTLGPQAYDVEHFEPKDGSRVKNEPDADSVNFPDGSITITGKVADPNDVEKLEILPPYKRGATPGTWEATTDSDYQDISSSLSSDAGSPVLDYVYTFSAKVDVEVGDPTKADRVFTFRATDKFGIMDTFELKLRVDKIRPKVSLLKGISTTPIAAGGNPNAPAANGIIEFVVGLEEENPEAIRYWFLPSAAETPVAGEAPATTDWGNEASPKGPGTLIPKNNWYVSGHSENQLSYTCRIDTTVLSDGWYQLYIMALDAADNFSINDADSFAVNLPLLRTAHGKAVYVTQATDTPQFSQVKPDGNFVGKQTLWISGRVSDDDGFASGTAVQVSFDNGATWSSAATNNFSNQGKAIDFRTAIPEPSTQDTFKYKLRVADDPAKKFPNDSFTPVPAEGYVAMPAAAYAAATAEVEYEYTYDTEAPALYFDTVLQSGKAFKNLPEYIYVGVVENRLNPLVPTAQTPNAGLSYNYENTGAAASPGGTFALGTHITKVAWSPAEAAADASGQTIYVAGETDPGTSPGNIKNDHPGAAVYRIPKALLNAQKAWGSVTNATDDGSRTIQFIAYDEAGNSSKPTFSFYKDTNPPAVDFTGIVNTSGYTSLTDAAKPISVIGFTEGSAPVLEGKFDDIYTPLRYETYGNLADIPALTYRLYQVRLGADISSPSFDPLGDATKFVEFTPTNGVKVPLGGTPFSGWDRTDNGKSISWAIDLKVGDIVDTSVGGTDQADKWKKGLTANAAIPDGLYVITITVQDLNNNAATYKKIIFRTDHAAPETEVTSPVQENAIYTASAYDPFTISGAAKDPNLKTLNIRIGNNGTPHDLTVTGSGITSSGITEAATGVAGVYTKQVTWSYVVPQSEFGPLNSDGEYSVFITATDENGETTEQEWRFIKDGLKVAVDPSSMDAGITHLENAPWQITGSAYDLNKVKQLQARIEEWDYTTGVASDGEPGSWKTAAFKDWFGILPAGAMDPDGDGMMALADFDKAAANLNWKILFNTSGTDDGDPATIEIPEGKYRIKFRHRDWSLGTGGDAGTVSGNFHQDDDAAAKVFYISPKEPTLAPDNDSPFIKGTGTSVTLGGTAADQNRIKQVRASASGGSSSTAVHYWPTDANANAFNSGNNPTQTYSITLTSLDTSGPIAVTLEAEDWSGRKSQRTLNFTLDNDEPEFEILYPADADPVKTAAPFDRLMGRDVIRGTGRDNNGLAKIEYKLGRTRVDSNSNGVYGDTGDEGGTWIEAANTGAVAVWDGTAFSWSLTFPNVNDLVPATGTSPNEWVEWVNPASADPVKGGGGELDNTKPQDRDVWLLPVMFKLTDLAGNEIIETRHYWVDRTGDRPKVSFDSPKDGGIVGGAITVTGKAEDSHGRVENVVYRVLNDASGNPGTTIALAEADTLFPADAFSNDVATRPALINPDGSSNITNGAWRLANISGNIRSANVQWNFKINTTGDLDPATDTESKPIYIEVMAYDSKQDAAGAYIGPTIIPAGAEADPGLRRKQNGWISRIKVTVEKGVPVFQEVAVYRDQASYPANKVPYNTTQGGLKGTVFVEALVTDDQGLESISYVTTGGTTVRINLDPAASPAPATGAGAWNAAWAYKTHGPGAGGNPYPGLHVYRVHVPVDLNGLASPPDGTHVFDFEFTAMDLSVPAHHPRTQIVPLQVDRFAPLGEYTGNSNAIGSNYLLQGRMWDREGEETKVGGNQRVEIWMRDGGGKFYRATASGGNPLEIANGTAVPAYIGRYVNGGSIAENVYASITGAPDSEGRRSVPRPASFITIEKNITSIGGGNEYITGWYPDGVYHEWTAEINTARLPAGVLTACFLVYDDAGNATYYEHPLIVRDGGPGIMGVSLATDLYNDDKAALNTPASGGKAAVINQEKAVSVNYEAITGFAARNELIYLRAMVNRNSAAAFNPYSYRLAYIGGAGAETAITALVKDAYYEIVDADSDGFSSWESVGLPIGVEAKTGAVFKATGKAWRGDGTARALTLTHSLSAPVISTENFTDPETGTVMNGLTTAAFTYDKTHFTGTGAIAPSQTVDINGDTKPDLDSNGHEILTGHPRFILEAADNKGISSFIVLAIPLVNYDHSKPELTLYDLNPKHETGREKAAAEPGALNAANPVLGSDTVNKNRGGLYNTTGSAVNVRKSGHIEPRKNTNAAHGGTLPDGTLGTANFARDALSGEVILRGWARDSRRVEKISLYFEGISGDPTLASIDILEWDPDERALTATAAAARNGVALAYASEVMNLTGHYVEWAFIWDTQNYPRAGGNPVVLFENLTVTAKAWDFNAAPDHDSGVAFKTHTDTSANAYQAIAVDLVPYITGIDRSFSTITNLRSKQGYYSLNRGETAALNGFNLSKSAAAADAALTIGAGTVSTKTPAVKTISFTVPTAAATGEIRLVSQSSNAVAKSLTAINSDSRVYTDANLRRTNSWNRENTQDWNADTWTDKRMARVWTSQTDDRFGGDITSDSVSDTDGTLYNNSSSSTYYNYTKKSSNFATDVSMAVNPVTGRLYGAWGWEDRSWALWGTEYTYTNHVWGKVMAEWTDPFDNIDIHYSSSIANGNDDARGYPNGKPIVVFNAGGTSGGTSPTAMTNKGGLYVFDYSASVLDLYLGKGILTAYMVEKTHHNTTTDNAANLAVFKADRFRNPRVITKEEHIHVSYYDQVTRSLKYWYGAEGVNATNDQYEDNTVRRALSGTKPALNAQRWVNLDGGWEQNDIRSTGNTLTYNATSRVRAHGSRSSDKVDNIPGTYYTDFATTQRAAGLWNAIALTASGKPVIVYYAQSDQKLLYTYYYGGNDYSVDGTDWSAPAVVPGGGSTNYGEYVSARIDSGGYLHIAYFDRANSALMYVRSTNTAPAYNFETPVQVDKTGAVGRWTDLSLDHYGNPWIVYEDIDRQGTTDGVKVAYIPGLTAKDTTLFKTAANWETMNLPGRSKVEADTRLNIENVPTQSLEDSLHWQAAVGYQEASGGYFRIAKLVSE
jgi:hypothetical protein